MEALADPQGGAVLAVAHQFALGFGGVPESLLALARLLRSVGVRCDVLSRNGFVGDAGRLPGLPPKGQSVRAGTAMPAQQSYQSILVAGAWNMRACKIVLQAKRRGVRVVYTPKGNLAYAEFKRPRDLKKIPYLATLELAVLAMADRIIYSSQLERGHSMLSPVFGAKSAVIPEPFIGPALTGPRPASARTVRFGFMAEIAPRKGLADLVTAFTAWQAKDAPDAELHIAGEPRPASERYCNGVRAIASRGPRPDRIVWRGPLRGQAREDFYDEIDFFVCPTRFESFGLTPLEALWHGTPVMVTRQLGALEFMTDPRSMIDLRSGRPDEILAGLQAAMARRESYAAAAGTWRSRACPALAADRLAFSFLDAFGFPNVATGDRRT